VIIILRVQSRTLVVFWVFIFQKSTFVELINEKKCVLNDKIYNEMFTGWIEINTKFIFLYPLRSTRLSP
jgi:hypothetical protein